MKTEFKLLITISFKVSRVVLFRELMYQTVVTTIRVPLQKQSIFLHFTIFEILT